MQKTAPPAGPPAAARGAARGDARGPAGDDVVAEVLDGLIADAEAGRPVDLEAACRAHPAAAAELRALYNTAGLVREFLGPAGGAGGSVAGSISRTRFRHAEDSGSGVGSGVGGGVGGGVGLASGDGSHSVGSTKPHAPGPADVTGPGVVRAPGGRAGVPDPPPGYEILEELGRGGMGVVYRARQTAAAREVALKMIRQAALASPEDAARFRREAEATATLDHPHIVPVFEVGGFEVGGFAPPPPGDGEDDRGDREGDAAGAAPYFSMRLIEGTTLDHEMRRGPRPPRELAATLAPVARAVQAAHEAGILHRDLKPSNILLDRAGRPFVTDFGLAGRVPDPIAASAAATDGPGGPGGPGGPEQPTLTQPGAILGTPAWMSPEQAGGRRSAVGPRSDVYSLGAILYAGLCGRPPFRGETPAATVLKVLDTEPRRPRKIHEDADPDLELIALKCLQKPADLRYPTAAALAEDLEAYLAGESISARSGRFTDLVHRTFRETHHAPVLENWGLLWMWHAAVLVALCLVTNLMQVNGAGTRLGYTLMWTVGLGVWAAIFWGLRRRAGPISFIERQIAHVWAASMAASGLLFAVEWILDMPPLHLSPVLGLIAGSVFFAKAGMLSGALYVPAVALFATTPAMAYMEATLPPEHDWGVLLFGLVTAAAFFFPGWKYRR